MEYMYLAGDLGISSPEGDSRVDSDGDIQHAQVVSLSRKTETM